MSKRYFSSSKWRVDIILIICMCSFFIFFSWKSTNDWYWAPGCQLGAFNVVINCFPNYQGQYICARGLRLFRLQSLGRCISIKLDLILFVTEMHVLHDSSPLKWRSPVNQIIIHSNRLVLERTRANLCPDIASYAKLKNKSYFPSQAMLDCQAPLQLM